MTAVPVGDLPDEPVTTVVTQVGRLIAVALPGQEASSGLVWRLAREVDSPVVRQVSEADVDGSVVVVFQATGAGSTSIAFALTRGEASPNAVDALIYEVDVT